MSNLSKDEIRSYATLGASRRLAEIQAEMLTITNAFPEIKVNGEQFHAPSRKAYTMSPAQKKKVSARMKKYWAERRAAVPEVGHRYPAKGGRPRLFNKEGRVIAS